MRESLLIIEGASQADALATYLKTAQNYLVLEWKGEGSFQQFTAGWEEALREHPRVAVLHGHCEALAERKVNLSLFRAIDLALWEVGFSLVLVMAKASFNAKLAAGYNTSVLPKYLHQTENEVTRLLEWIGTTNEGRRAKAGGIDEPAARGELRTGLLD